LNAKFSGAIGAGCQVTLKIPEQLATQLAVEIRGYIFELTLICLVGQIHRVLQTTFRPC